MLLSPTTIPHVRMYVYTHINIYVRQIGTQDIIN